MTFGKDQDAKQEGSKGGKTQSDIRNWKLSLALKRKWKDSTYRKKHIGTIIKINSNRTREELSEMGKKSRIYENLIEQKIKNSFDLIFKPYEVCDRIGIRDNKIFFIEIKNIKNKRLTEKQRAFKNIVGTNYIIEY